MNNVVEDKFIRWIKRPHLHVSIAVVETGCIAPDLKTINQADRFAFLPKAAPEEPMKKNFCLTWKGIFLELCMGRIQSKQKDLLQVNITAPDADHKQLWYENEPFLQSHFNTENWWAIDDLDHVMGLVFDDRLALEEKLSTISFAIDSHSVTVDPKALQMHFYAPEAHSPLKDGEWILRHGTNCQAKLCLKTEIRPPFDPEFLTLSFIQYPDVGYVLIDLDYDGHDDIQFTWEEKSYLPPQIIGKENLRGTSSKT